MGPAMHMATVIECAAAALQAAATRSWHRAERRASSVERAGAVVPTTKQYLLHHGFPIRRSTAGKVAFRPTPPELSGGTVYRFNVCHIMQVDELRRCSRSRSRISDLSRAACLPHARGFLRMTAGSGPWLFL